MGDGIEIGLHLSLVAVSAQFLESSHLLAAHLGVVDFEDVDGILVVECILVDAHDCLTTAVDACLGACCSLLDAHFGHTGLDGLGHAAQFLNFLDV